MQPLYRLSQLVHVVLHLLWYLCVIVSLALFLRHMLSSNDD